MNLRALLPDTAASPQGRAALAPAPHPPGPSSAPEPADDGLQEIHVLASRLDQLQKNQAQLEAELKSLADRLSDLVDSTQTLQAFGWDYVALTRRLTALEDHIQTRTAAR